MLLQIKNKEVSTKYGEFWDGIKDVTKRVNDGEAGEYGKDLIKIRFVLDYNLLSNKILKLDLLAVIVRSVFEEDNKFYTHIFLDECLYEL